MLPSKQGGFAKESTSLGRWFAKCDGNAEKIVKNERKRVELGYRLTIVVFNN